MNNLVQITVTAVCGHAMGLQSTIRRMVFMHNEAQHHKNHFPNSAGFVLHIQLSVVGQETALLLFPPPP